MSQPLRIGFVPGLHAPATQRIATNVPIEHFSTPIHFAQKYFGLGATLIPFPSGTGHMITLLQANEIDVGIGLTEGWVAGIGKQGEKAGFKIVGTYVETPLCWAISTGANRELKDVSELKDKKIGVSRIGRYVHYPTEILNYY